MRLGIENHKDWRVDEQVALLKQYSSEYVGVTLDTGNNLSVLDDPMETVEKLAPYTFNVHFKDMAVEETATGFLMSEVPLGDGLLDLKRMVDTIRGARPDVYFSLEMITRDPLDVPCVTDKYWATFGDVQRPGVVAGAHPRPREQATVAVAEHERAVSRRALCARSRVRRSVDPVRERASGTRRQREASDVLNRTDTRAPPS